MTDNIICPDPKIVFSVDKEWIMELSPEGIRFNREKFSNLKPDDFALEVIKILETQFSIKFTKI